MSIDRADRVQLARLRTRTADALDELTELTEFRSHDPAAADAMRAIRLARQTLEWFWIPALDHDLEGDRRHHPASG